MPDLTTSIFLQGYSSAGGIGGANSKTLSTSQMPSHSHDHTHAHSINNIVGGDHSHPVQMRAGHNSNDFYALINNDATGGNTSGGNTPYWYFNAGIQPSGSADDWPDVSLGTGSMNHSHNSLATNNNTAITTTNTGSGSAIDFRPNYFNVVYVMRVR